MSKPASGGGSDGEADAVERFLADPMGEFRRLTGEPKPQPVENGVKLVALRRAQARLRDPDPDAATRRSVEAATRHAVALYAAGTQGPIDSTARAALDVVEFAETRAEAALARGGEDSWAEDGAWVRADVLDRADDRLTSGRSTTDVERQLHREGVYREMRLVVADIATEAERDGGAEERGR